MRCSEWRQYFHPQRWYLRISLQDVTIQKTDIEKLGVLDTVYNGTQVHMGIFHRGKFLAVLYRSDDDINILFTKQLCTLQINLRNFR
jgi:hypothetical protein